MIKWIISSSGLILITIISRRLFKGKISSRLQYALWILVAVRLLIPVNLGNSILSIENITNQVAIHQQTNVEVQNEATPDRTEEFPDRIKVFDSIEVMNHSGNAELYLEESQNHSLEVKGI